MTLTRPQYLTLTGLGAASLLFAVTNAGLFLANRARQREATERQTAVQVAVQLQTLQTELAKALAELALKSNDRQVLDMLAANGITINMNTAPTKAEGAR